MTLVIFTIIWFSGTTLLAGLLACALTRDVSVEFTPTARPTPGQLKHIRKIASRIDQWAEESGARLDSEQGWMIK